MAWQGVLVVLMGVAVCGITQAKASNLETEVECYTPNRRAGKCVSIKQCPQLFELVQLDQEEDVSEYLRMSQCGKDNSDPKVCCGITDSSRLPTRFQADNGDRKVIFNGRSLSDIIRAKTPHLAWYPLIGNKCKDMNGTARTCKNIKECLTITKDQKEGEVELEMCVQNSGKETYVCCEPEVKYAPNYGKKAKEMCKEYGKAVYLVLEDLFGEYQYAKDTCFWNYIGSDNLGSNGEDAQPWEFPHMALIGYGEPSSIQWLCGGSLISDRYVLSAAHCTVSAIGVARWVRLGDLNFQSRDDDAKGQANSTEFEIVERINHPDYNPSFTYNDIALYKLNSTVQFNGFIRPICLNTNYELKVYWDLANRYYEVYRATGWGVLEWGGKQSEILQNVVMHLSSKQQCADAYNTTVGIKLKHGIDDLSMLCAGDVELGRDTCPGDSGGPLQVRFDNNDMYCMYLQVGVVSSGSLCGGNKPGIYTRVSHYIPWIESVVWP